MAIWIYNYPSQLILARQAAMFYVNTNYTAGALRIIGRVSGETGDSLVPDGSGNVVFEMSDYVKGLSLIRGKTTDTPSKYTTLPVAKKFTFEEYYGSPPIVHGSDETEYFYVLDGKVPHQERKQLYKTYANLLSYLVASKSCLTWFPAAEYKRVLPTQKEFLNYMQVKTNGDVSLKIVITLILDDNTAVNGPTQTAIDNVSYMQIVYFPTGVAQLDLDTFVSTNHAGRTLKSYSVVVMSGSTPYSAFYFFKVDRNWYDNPRYIWIMNPYGFWEVLLCTGLTTRTDEHSPETAVTDGVLTAEKLVWKSTHNDIVKTNTGFITKLQARWLSSLLDTTEARELIDGVLEPIILLQNKVTVIHDGEYQYSADIEYEYAYTEPLETA